MTLKYAKYYSEVKRAKPIFVLIVELSMILHISYFPVSHAKNRRSFIKELQNQNINETLVGLLNWENKHAINALAGFIAGGRK